jgi:hypothetical protein
MRKGAKGAWQSKRGPTRSLPPFTDWAQVEERTDLVEVLDSQVVVDREEAKSESEDDTRFGVLWEKLVDPVQNDRQTDVIQGIVIESETVQAREMSEQAVVIPDIWSCPFRDLIIPEAEYQNSDIEEDNIPVSDLLNRQKKVPVVETVVGMKVAKAV